MPPMGRLKFNVLMGGNLFGIILSEQEIDVIPSIDQSSLTFPIRYFDTPLISYGMVSCTVYVSDDPLNRFDPLQ